MSQIIKFADGKCGCLPTASVSTPLEAPLIEGCGSKPAGRRTTRRDRRARSPEEKLKLTAGAAETVSHIAAFSDAPGEAIHSGVPETTWLTNGRRATRRYDTETAEWEPAFIAWPKASDPDAPTASELADRARERRAAKLRLDRRAGIERTIAPSVREQLVDRVPVLAPEGKRLALSDRRKVAASFCDPWRIEDAFIAQTQRYKLVPILDAALKAACDGAPVWLTRQRFLAWATAEISAERLARECGVSGATIRQHIRTAAARLDNHRAVGGLEFLRSARVQKVIAQTYPPLIDERARRERLWTDVTASYRLRAIEADRQRGMTAAARKAERDSLPGLPALIKIKREDAALAIRRLCMHAATRFLRDAGYKELFI